MADSRDQLAMPAGFHPQHAEPALLAVECDAFYQTGENLVRCLG
jgi:hypothetical protein